MFKYLKSVFILLFLGLFVIGFYNYIGSKLVYLIFGIISLAMILTPFRKDYYFFEIFFTIIIFVTFWLDFVVTISFFNYNFEEGRGFFSFNSNSLDDVLIISSLISFTIIVSIIFRSLIFPKKEKFENKIIFNLQIKKKLEKYQFYIFLFLLLVVIIIGYTNYHFSIYQRGLISKNEVNFLIEGSIKWLLLFGFSSFFCIIIDLFISNKIYKKFYIFMYSFFLILETFISNISIFSRGNFLNSSSVVFAMYKEMKKNREIFFTVTVLLIFLFFLIGIEILSPLRGDPSLVSNISDTNNFINSNDYDFNIFREFVIISSNFFQAVFARLFGIEALMAVYSLDNLGFSLLYEAATNKPQIGEPSFFDNLKNDIRVNSNDLVSFTLPGIVGFLYYSGSIPFLIISIFIIITFFNYVEFLVFRFCNNNLLLCSLFSQVIAFRLWHFGYNFPNTYLIFLAILLNLLFVILIYKCLRIYKK